MFKIELDYPTTSKNQPRYIVGDTNKYIEQALAVNFDSYHATLSAFKKYFPKLMKIDAYGDKSLNIPYYINDFLAALDCVSLYCIIAEVKPKIYLEVGSGTSTKFARRSIVDNNLTTLLLSIDPNPRAEIDKLCDEVIREPLDEY